MSNSALFDLTITHTLQSRELHVIMMTIEYFLTFFSHASSSVTKVKSYNASFSYSEIEKFFIFLLQRKLEAFKDDNDYIYKAISVTFIAVAFVSVFAYFLLEKLYKAKGTPNLLVEIFVNFFGVFLCRYLCFFVLDAFSFCLFTSVRKGGYSNGFLSVLVLFFYLFLILFMLYYTSEYAFSFRVTNENVLRKKIEYPFDYHNVNFDLLLLILKLLIVLESNYLLSQNLTVDKIDVLLNALVIFFSLALFCFAFIDSSAEQRILSQLKANFFLLYVRKFFIFFNLSLIIFSFFNKQKRDFYSDFLNVILTLFISALLVKVNKTVFENRKFKCLKPSYDLITALLVNKIDFQKLQTKESEGKTGQNQIKFSFYDSLTMSLKIYHCSGTEENQEATRFSSYEDIFLWFVNHNNKPPEHGYQNDFIWFLYSLIKKDIFKINKFYHKLKNDPHINRHLSNTVSFLFTHYSKEGQTLSNFFIQRAIQINGFSSEVEETLIKYETFIHENCLIKRGSSMMELGKRIFEQKKKVFSLSKTASTKDQMLIEKGEEASATPNVQLILTKIQASIQYNLFILRYIIETLVDKESSEFPELKIELLEDFLQFHFQNDNLLILSLDEGNLEMLKCTGENQTKNITHLFTNHFYKEGVEKLLETFKNTNKAEYEFEFITQRKCFIQHFKFNFRLAQLLFNNKLVLYGFHSKNFSKSIVLQRNFRGKIVVKGMSKNLASILMIQRDTAKIIFGDFKSELHFEHVFSKFTSQETFRDLFELKEFNCEVQFDKYLPKMDALIKQWEKENKLLLKENKNAAQKDENVEDPQVMKKGKIIKFNFKKVFDINENASFYRCTIEDDKLKSKGKKSRTKQGKTPDEDFEASNYIEFEMDMVNSSTSMTENSGTETSIASQIAKKERKENKYHNPVIKKVHKKISLVSFATLLTNGVLFLLSIIFLVSLIRQVNSLSSSNTFLFSFKLLRHCFNHVIFSTISFVCVEDDPENANSIRCNNDYINYLHEYQKELNYTDHTIVELLWFEMKYKLNTLKDFYFDLKKELNTKSFKRFRYLVEQEMKFYVFEQRPNQLIQKFQNISFEQAIERIINSEYVLIDHGIEFVYEPYHIVSLDPEGNVDFSSVKNQNYNIVQREMTSIYLNFVNFFMLFTNSEDTIGQYFLKLRNTNLIFTFSFMGIFILLNFLLLFINLNYLKLSQSLFLKLFVQSVKKLSNVDYKEFASKRIKYLIILSKLYSQNPNVISKKIKKNLLEYHKKLRAFNLALERTHTEKEKLEAQSKEEEMMLENLFNEESFQMSDFIKENLTLLVRRSIMFYVVYLVFIAACDVVLINTLLKVYDLKSYVEVESDYQTMVYSDISMVHLYRLINQTEERLESLLGTEGQPDGSITYYLRSAHNLAINLISLASSGKYPNQHDYYSYECEEMYDDIGDSLLKEFYLEKNLSDTNKIYGLPRRICKDLDFNVIKDLIFEDVVNLLQITHKQYPDRTFEGMYGLIRDVNFYKAYLYIHFYIRPVKRNFYSSILFPAVKNAFSNYIKLVWIYLIINICFEVLSFVFHKIFIFKKIDYIERYFSTFVDTIL